jgi:signal transduction histidine kinase
VGTLAAGAAHELNTPLSTLGLRIRRIGRRHDDPETLRDLEVMHTQLDRCSRVVEQLLVGAGDPSASGLEPHDVLALVREGSTLWRKGSGVPVEIDGTTGLFAEIPRIAFVQALINLLENAREAQEEAGRSDAVAVNVGLDEPFVVITIRDHGVGMPDGSDRIGEPFYTTKPTGTGLGVFVARAVADGSGGGLAYKPGDDGGTVARWWFPELRGDRHERITNTTGTSAAGADRR